MSAKFISIVSDHDMNATGRCRSSRTASSCFARGPSSSSSACRWSEKKRLICLLQRLLCLCNCRQHLHGRNHRVLSESADLKMACLVEALACRRRIQNRPRRGAGCRCCRTTRLRADLHVATRGTLGARGVLGPQLLRALRTPPAVLFESRRAEAALRGASAPSPKAVGYVAVSVGTHLLASGAASRWCSKPLVPPWCNPAAVLSIARRVAVPPARGSPLCPSAPVALSPPTRAAPRRRPGEIADGGGGGGSRSCGRRGSLRGAGRGARSPRSRRAVLPAQQNKRSRASARLLDPRRSGVR
eukprot:57691-Chlamydomonas_euryale.AAC.4